MEYMPSGPLGKEQALAKFNDTLEPSHTSGDSHSFAILRWPHSEVIGLYRMDFERFSAAYAHSMVMDRSTWGTGMAKEAYNLILSFAFDMHGIHRVWSAVSTANERARKLVTKSGLKEVGEISEYAPRIAGWMDCMVYSCTQQEWRAHVEKEGIRTTLLR